MNNKRKKRNNPAKFSYLFLFDLKLAIGYFTFAGTVIESVTLTVTVIVLVTLMVTLTGRSPYSHGTVTVQSRDGNGTVTACKFLSRHVTLVSRLHDSNVISTVIVGLNCVQCSSRMTQSLCVDYSLK